MNNDHVPLDYFSTLRFMGHPARWNMIVRDETMPPPPLPSDPAIRAELLARLEQGLAEARAGLGKDWSEVQADLLGLRKDVTNSNRHGATSTAVDAGTERILLAPQPWQRSR